MDAAQIARLTLKVKPTVISAIEQKFLHGMDEHEPSGTLANTNKALIQRLRVITKLKGDAEGVPFTVVGLQINEAVVSIQRALAS